ncbi:MAG: hypothetical protein EOP84_15830 [Verrucomicrobiaceae bacterium]|nr:MAG: hypothetical protein EOP84_15830 [Verrucomicrobiaceae bacterium]
MDKIPDTRRVHVFRLPALFAGLLLILLVGFHSQAVASQQPPQVLNVKTYASASGKHVLEVDPTDLYGRGPGNYRMMIEGKEVWSAALPFTLYDAKITNDGTTIGYAYQHGKDGFAIKGGYSAGAGTLHVVILDPRGGVRLNQITEREHSAFFHSPPDPVVKGILLHETEDTVTIRATTWMEETWWTYRISDGIALQRFPLKGTAQYLSARRPSGAVPLPGMPLNLLHAQHNDWATERAGALFLLVDQEGKTVWSLDLPDDYTASGDDLLKWRIRRTLEENGAILEVGQEGRFSLWFAAESKKVTFQVSRTEGEKTGWNVVEVAREPYEIPTEKETPPPLPERPLKHLGSFKLQADLLGKPISGVGKFEFDSSGRIGMVRWDKEKATYLFVLLDPVGKPVTEAPIPAVRVKEGKAQMLLAFLGGEKWVIIETDFFGKESSQVWWFDVVTNTLSGAMALDCPDIEAVTALGDGGFVALGTRHFPNTRTDEVHAVDAIGQTRWKWVERGYDGKESSLISPKDLTVTRDGEIAVLDNIGRKVQFFDASNTHRRTVDLEKVWGREPNYPTGIMPDVEGGFIVFDFNGAERFVRMKSDGSMRGPLQPRYQDGRKVDADRIRIAPDGRLWTTDGQALLRLNAEGIVD